MLSHRQGKSPVRWPLLGGQKEPLLSQQTRTDRATFLPLNPAPQSGQGTAGKRWREAVGPSQGSSPSQTTGSRCGVGMAAGSREAASQGLEPHQPAQGPSPPTPPPRPQHSHTASIQCVSKVNIDCCSHLT